MHHSTSSDQLDSALESAWAVFLSGALQSLDVRRRLLEGLADALDAKASSLIPIADQETHLGTARLTGEVARTSFQLRLLAQVSADRSQSSPLWVDSVEGPPPAGHPPLLRDFEPLGPVGMFSASNFPFAFSVLGGDTASALAAGCPVVVKGHPGHPRLSAATAELARGVAREQQLPEDVLQLVMADGHELGVALCQHPLTAAVAFTGSVQGGVALWKACQQRPRPIPFFGELGSVNPIVVLESALASKGPALAEALSTSITMGCGQFCTSPGIVLLPEGALGNAFRSDLAQKLSRASTHPMLNASMEQNFQKRVWAARQCDLSPLVEPKAGCQIFLAELSAAQFISQAALHDEIFGSACLLVRVRGIDEIEQVLATVEGSLTCTLWGLEEDTEQNRRLLTAARRLAGRVLFSGVPTGVAVAAGMQHGGPFPSSTMPATTSVGPDALMRFLRPVCLQDPPQWVRENVLQSL
ncbi:PutA NAD-dependent aldehyde dehydrogenases [Burkholderiales bacterium]